MTEMTLFAFFQAMADRSGCYTTVGSNNLERAKKFYDELFDLVGSVQRFDHPTGGRLYCKEGAFFLGVISPFNDGPATAGNGSMFVLIFDTRPQVDAFYTKALELGATDEGAPGERAPMFYFSYVRDLDGNKLGAFCVH